MDRTAFAFELKETGADGTFTGLASVYGVKDLGGDIVVRGAFTKTLQERGASVPILWQHDQHSPIGRGTLTDGMSGLTIKGKLSLGVAKAREAYELMKDGVVGGLSIGYDVVKQKYDNGARLLTELKLWEISAVTFPMCTEAIIQAVKERKAGQRLSAASRDAIDEALGHMQRGNAAHRKAHKAAVGALEALLDDGADREDDKDDDDVKALRDSLARTREILLTPFAQKAPTLDDIARKMRHNNRRILAMLDGAL